MGRERRGSIRVRDGKIYARVIFTNDKGIRQEKQKIVANKTEARQVLKGMLRDIEDYNANILDGDTMTFKDLADYVIVNYLKEAEYINDRKISGQRGYKSTLGHFRPVIEYFGNKVLRSIKWSDIATYKIARLKIPTWYGKARAIATVNRELASLRRALQIAKQQGWIRQNPFMQGDSLISIAAE